MNNKDIPSRLGASVLVHGRLVVRQTAPPRLERAQSGERAANKSFQLCDAISSPRAQGAPLTVCAPKAALTPELARWLQWRRPIRSRRAPPTASANCALG